PTNFIHLFWTEKWEQADQRYIGTRFERLVQTLGVQNATANSIRHAFSTEQAAQGFDGRTINVFTHHTSDSKMNKKFYIFAVNKEQDSIASALVKNHSEKQATYIILKIKGVEQESPQEMDYNNLLQQMMIYIYLHSRLLFHLFPPKQFRPNPSLKLSLRTITRVQKPRYHKYRRIIKKQNHKKKLKTHVLQRILIEQQLLKF
ncbi:MAG: hypothetical protein EZS28_048585, partial [Streblomastix strix]